MNGEPIETARFRLRPLTMDDVDDLLPILGDAVAMRWYERTWDRDGAAAWIERQLDRYAADGFGPWAVEWKATGKFAGQCGLARQEVAGVSEVEIGYLTVPAYWGHGVATEAASAWRNYAFRELAVNRVVSLINVHNCPSRRVAEKLGMRREQEIMRAGMPHYVYALENA